MAAPHEVPRHASTASIQSENVFRTMVESVIDYAIFALDTTGHIMTWNLGAERLKQYKRDEIIGQHFSVFYPEADKQAHKPEYELKVATETGRFEDEDWRIRKDGTKFWANVIITRLNNEKGELIGFGKVTRDLTERRAAELRYRRLVEGISDYAIYSLDVNGMVTSWNTGAERIKGYTADEIIGRHFSQFYTPEDRAKGMPEQVLRTARETGHYEGEGWRVRKDGSRFWTLAVVTALRDSDGTLTGYSKITRDMTERKRLLDQVRQHAEELEVRIREQQQITAELEAFSYSVSHDLRAPIRAITGFAEALREEYENRLDETACDYLEQITGAAGRMNQLVQDLLNYSRLSRTEMELQPVSVAAMARAARKELGADADKVTLQVPEELKVMAHEPTLVQAVLNLMANAVKFHAPGVTPQVKLSAAGAGPWIRIEVRDNGIGIAPQHQERIFKVFERLHGREEFPGTGIGLAIVKRGVERIGGRLGLDSAVGQGSTFWLELPAARATQE